MPVLALILRLMNWIEVVMNVTLKRVFWLRVCKIRKPLPICSLGNLCLSCSLIKGKRSSKDMFTSLRFNASTTEFSCLKTSSSGLISKSFVWLSLIGTNTVIFSVEGSK